MMNGYTFLDPTYRREFERLLVEEQRLKVEELRRALGHVTVQTTTWPAAPTVPTTGGTATSIWGGAGATDLQTALNNSNISLS